MTPWATLVLWLTAGAAAPAPAPCQEAPPGMVCVPGGPAVVGRDDGPASEQPPRTVFVDTFYVDVHEVTVERYDACVARGACPPRKHRRHPMAKPFSDPEQPAVPVDWKGARAYCAFAGKRLLTEWEWEKAARGPEGSLYPWGDEAPTCERAWSRECAPPKGAPCTRWPGGKKARWDCKEHATKKVGSFPAGHYGVFDLAGNGYEWTQTAWRERCAGACLEDDRDPDGPCDGAYPCFSNPKRVLKGGSWYWPNDRLLGSHRRGELPSSGGHRLSARCGSSSPQLYAWPPVHLTEPPPDPGPLVAPTDEQRAAFAVVEQDDLTEKPDCEDGGRQREECRDPNHYIHTNEPRQEVWAPYLKNLGGGYAGVGIDQNYSLVAAAKSEWVWLFDYDPTIVRLHMVLRALILASPTPEDLVDRFAAKREQESEQIVEDAWAEHPEQKRVVRAFRWYRKALGPYLARQLKPSKKKGDFGWLRNPEHYAHVRTLYQQGRIALLKGDLLGSKTVRGIGEAARRLSVPVRVFYPSNAPENWDLPQAYRDNVRSLPFDERSVILQTMAGTKTGFGQKGYWHYNIEGGRHAQELLAKPGYDRMAKMLGTRIPTDEKDLTVVGLPSAPLVPQAP